MSPFRHIIWRELSHDPSGLPAMLHPAGSGRQQHIFTIQTAWKASAGQCADWLDMPQQLSQGDVYQSGWVATWTLFPFLLICEAG